VAGDEGHVMKALAEQINELDGIEIYGRVVGLRGLMVEISGPLHMSRSAPGLLSRPKPSPFLATWPASPAPMRCRCRSRRCRTSCPKVRKKQLSLADGYRRLDGILNGSETER